LIVCLLPIGCTTTDPDSLASASQGVAELRVDTDSFSGTITRVTVDAAGQTQDLAFNPTTGTFDAALFLPSGTQTVTARAFQDDTLVGASSPTEIAVQAGVVTRVQLRIIDVTVDVPNFGPIFDSLTFPTTAQVGAPATFALSVVAPVGEPVSYSWSSSCASSTFTAPDAASTSWTSTAEGSCRIDVVAISHGIAVSKNFFVVVFPAGSLNGAVNVSGLFVSAPALDLRLDAVRCEVFTGSFNSSCVDAIASPSTSPFSLSTFGWGLSTPGTLELSDNCGGRFGAIARTSDFMQGTWLPPAAGGLCIITGRAINGDGAVGTVTAAVLVHQGTPATSQAPQLRVEIDTNLNACAFGNNDPSSPLNCGAGSAGATAFVFISMNWLDGIPDSLQVSDDCGGGVFQASNPNSLFHSWTIAGSFGQICTVTARAVSLQGAESTATGIFTVF
jgi:hypothetical protein